MSDPEKEAGKEDKEPVEAWVQRLLEPRPAPFLGALNHPYIRAQLLPTTHEPLRLLGSVGERK